MTEMRVRDGHSPYAVRTPDGIRLMKSDREFEAQMAVARRIMQAGRDVLRAPAG